MLASAIQKKCSVYDISNRNIIIDDDVDFDSLLPRAEGSPDYDSEELNEYQQKQKHTQGMDVLPLDLFKAMLHHCLFRKDYRTAFWLTAQANTGLRYSDIIKLRRADLVYSNGTAEKIRKQILIQEKKTDKQRIIYVNKAIKETLLMLLWNKDISPMHYLITSDSRNKGYETEKYIDSTGHEKTLRKNGRIVYKLDENGNKIPKPLTRKASEEIMKRVISESLTDTGNDCAKYNTHSLRKLYGKAITDSFVNNYNSEEMNARTAAMHFLSQDYGHSSEAMTTRYSKDFDVMKRDIVMEMNLGLDIIEPFFQEEMINYLSRG